MMAIMQRHQGARVFFCVSWPLCAQLWHAAVTWCFRNCIVCCESVLGIKQQYMQCSCKENADGGHGGSMRLSSAPVAADLRASGASFLPWHANCTRIFRLS